MIITHWDDDHINGAAETYRKASSSKLAISAALSSTEFESILAAWRPALHVSGGSGVGEIDRIYAELSSRRARGHHPSAILASENKILFTRDSDLPASVKALSPSDSSVLAAAARFSSIFQNISRKCRLPDIQNNHASVVLSLKIGKIQLLLGGDLQVRADRSFGWFAIMDSGPHGIHELFKVSHHGSANGHHPEVWEGLLCPSPLAVITPFVRGNIALPTVDDCRNILSRTTNAFLTASPRPRSFRDSDTQAEKAIKQTLRNVHSSPSSFGQVRARKDVTNPNSDWSVELIGDALTLSDYVGL